MKKYLPDWFIAGLLLMIVIAWIIPGVGMDTRPIHLGLIIDIGVVLIFFFYGLKLDPEKLKRGMSNWRMHLAIQLTTFLVFPLLVLPFYPLLKGTSYELFWMGMFFLAALPSTVSSSVVMVSIAGGNIPGAIFNASISGIIGIVMTPFWMGLFLTASAEGFDFSDVMIQLITQIIFPVVAGLLLHRFFVRWVNRHLKKLATFDKIIILLIVYESFSHSFLAGMFSSVSWPELAGLFAVVIALFFIVLYFTGLLAKWLQFSREDRITLRFAGSKKSLVHGSVFASVLFAGISGAGIYLLPIMIYHAFQLFYISLIARQVSYKVTR
jgi:solute carrier family 10 (sodium/bile acid cotransporter), member 7